MSNFFVKHFSVFMLAQVVLVVFFMLINTMYFKPHHPSLYNPNQGLLAFFFVIICTLIHAILLSFSTKNPKQFIPYFMGSMGLKLFATFGFMILYVLLHKNEAKSFLINCTLGYFSFTFAHVALILIAVNSKESKSQALN
jgi:hypothetical protein